MPSPAARGIINLSLRSKLYRRTGCVDLEGGWRIQGFVRNTYCLTGDRAYESKNKTIGIIAFVMPSHVESRNDILQTSDSGLTASSGSGQIRPGYGIYLNWWRCIRFDLAAHCDHASVFFLNQYFNLIERYQRNTDYSKKLCFRDLV